MTARQVESIMLAGYCWTLIADVHTGKMLQKFIHYYFYVTYILSVIKCIYRSSSKFNGTSIRNLAW
jgi:hypothetical protein